MTLQAKANRRLPKTLKEDASDSRLERSLIRCARNWRPAALRSRNLKVVRLQASFGFIVFQSVEFRMPNSILQAIGRLTDSGQRDHTAAYARLPKSTKSLLTTPSTLKPCKTRTSEIQDPKLKPRSPTSPETPDPEIQRQSQKRRQKPAQQTAASREKVRKERGLGGCRI